MVFNNAVGAGQAPTYGQFYDTGFNVCWTKCLTLTDATKPEFYSSYLQQVNGGSTPTNANAVLISAVDATQSPVTGSINAQFHGGVYFGGLDVFLDMGTGTIIEGANVFGQGNSAIRCGNNSNGLTVKGVNTYDVPSNLPIATQDYGVQLDAGCITPNIDGTIFGLKAQLNNLASPATEVIFNGQLDPPPSYVITGGSQTLDVASHPALYQGQPGYFGVVEGSGSFAPVSYTTDTATAILASLNNPQVGTPISIIIRNHNHKSMLANPDATITLVGGTGVTITGIATVPDSGGPTSGVQAGYYTYRLFQGTVTNVGSPAITLHGCSLLAGAAC